MLFSKSNFIRTEADRNITVTVWVQNTLKSPVIYTIHITTQDVVSPAVLEFTQYTTLTL